MWLWNERGNVGKSALSSFLVDHCNALLLTTAEEGDILNDVCDDFVSNDHRSRSVRIMDISWEPATTHCTSALRNCCRDASSTPSTSRPTSPSTHNRARAVQLAAARNGHVVCGSLQTGDKISTAIDLAPTEVDCDEHSERTRQLGPERLSWMPTCLLSAATWHASLRPLQVMIKVSPVR